MTATITQWLFSLSPSKTKQVKRLVRVLVSNAICHDVDDALALIHSKQPEYGKFASDRYGSDAKFLTGRS